MRAILASSLCVALAGTWLPAHAAPMRPDATVGGNAYGALLPIGEYITPLVAPGSSLQQLSTGLRADGTADANGGISTVLSPDGKTLLVLTSGYNTGFSTTSGTSITVPYLNPITGIAATGPSAQTNTFQWVLVYDVSGTVPVQKQRIALTSAYQGIAWNPEGTRFYVSGGKDDRVYIYKQSARGWLPDAPFVILNHDSNGTNTVPSFDAGAQVAGVSISADGKYLFAVNHQNNSITVADARTRKVSGEFTLPGTATDNGQFPVWATPHAGSNGATDKLYVSSIRDGRIVVFTSAGAQKSIFVGGEPNKSVLSRDGSRLYAINPDLDQIDVINTVNDTLFRVIDIRRPGYRYHGASPNSLALSANGATLYVTIAGENAVGVIDVASGTVLGRIPTAWYPSSITISADGKNLYISNMKANTGPNPYNGYLTSALPPNDTTFRFDYVLGREKGGLESLPIPDQSTLAYLSAIVDANNRFTANRQISPMMRYLRTKIKHVIYIQKENRTYDEILGDLPIGNGDPSLAYFPQPLTPNFHSLAMQFTDMDNFYTAGDVSGDGWNWDYEGYNNDYNHQAQPIGYAGDGFFGSNNFENLKNSEDNAGTSDDRPGQTGGYLWDSALRAGLSIRHYGQFGARNTAIVRYADRSHTVQGLPIYAPLVGRSDVYFRPWDVSTPDEYRFEEWKDEFDAYVKNGKLPNFEFMCIMMDHTGAFSGKYANVGGLTTPELDAASNDHAIGQIVDAVSHSPYWASTAIFIEEDDSQAGPDHIDSHRSPAYIISPYTAHNKVVHTFYTTVNVDRTMEDLLGMDYLGLNDANAASMDDVFATQPDLQPYNVLIPGNLCQPPVHTDLVPDCYNPQMQSRKTRAIRTLHDGRWWGVHTNRFSFRTPDGNDAGKYNRLLWEGIVGKAVAYPEDRTGNDLTQNRTAFLTTARSPLDTTR